MRKCPICDTQINAGTWCRTCHQFVTPIEYETQAHLNEGHGDHDEDCDYHNPQFEADTHHTPDTPNPFQRVSPSPYTSTGNNHSHTSSAPTTSSALVSSSASGSASHFTPNPNSSYSGTAIDSSSDQDLGDTTSSSIGSTFGSIGSSFDSSFGSSYDTSFGGTFDSSFGSSSDSSIGSSFDSSFGSSYDTSFGGTFDSSFGSSSDSSIGSSFDSSFGSSSDSSIGSSFDSSFGSSSDSALESDDGSSFDTAAYTSSSDSSDTAAHEESFLEDHSSTKDRTTDTSASESSEIEYKYVTPSEPNTNSKYDSDYAFDDAADKIPSTNAKKKNSIASLIIFIALMISCCNMSCCFGLLFDDDDEEETSYSGVYYDPDENDTDDNYSSKIPGDESLLDLELPLVSDPYERNGLVYAYEYTADDYSESIEPYYDLLAKGINGNSLTDLAISYVVDYGDELYIYYDEDYIQAEKAFDYKESDYLNQPSMPEIYEMLEEQGINFYNSGKHSNAYVLISNKEIKSCYSYILYNISFDDASFSVELATDSESQKIQSVQFYSSEGASKYAFATDILPYVKELLQYDDLKESDIIECLDEGSAYTINNREFWGYSNKLDDEEYFSLGIIPYYEHE